MKSQFIVVSLKDGMFNNANVLFKTKFVDGLSTVRRFTQQQPEDKENGKKGAAAAAAAAPSVKGAARAKPRAITEAN